MRRLNTVDEYLLDDPLKSDTQRDFLVRGLHYILITNYFMFGDEIYHQRSGTAMGTKEAPTSWLRRSNMFFQILPIGTILPSVGDI